MYTVTEISYYYDKTVIQSFQVVHRLLLKVLVGSHPGNSQLLKQHVKVQQLLVMLRNLIVIIREQLPYMRFIVNKSPSSYSYANYPSSVWSGILSKTSRPTYVSKVRQFLSLRRQAKPTLLAFSKALTCVPSMSNMSLIYQKTNNWLFESVMNAPKSTYDTTVL